MKKIVVFVALLCLSVSVFSQEKGQSMLSGNISAGVSSIKVKDEGWSNKLKSNRNFGFLLGYQYFVSDKVALGIGLKYDLEKMPQEFGDLDDDTKFDKISLFSFEPKLSYYVKITNNFYYAPNFYLNVGFGKYKEEVYEDDDDKTNLTAFSIGITPICFEFKPSDRVGISFSCGTLGYNTLTAKFDEDSDFKITQRTFNFKLNTTATVGFNYYF